MKDETRNTAQSMPLCGFLVIGTKKGGFPIAVETRSKGKKVTVLNSVRGDLRALLTTLTSRMGVGGTYHEERSQVEIQGDHSERLPRILFQLGCLRGVNVTKFQEKPATDAATKQPAVREKPRWDKEKIAYEKAVMEDKKIGGCWNWHGWWPYCRGNCTRPNPYDDDVWTQNLQGVSQRTAYVPEFTDIMEGLRHLGMLAEPGEAVKAEHRERALAAQSKNAGTKPAKPQTIFSPVHRAPVEQAFVCKYCGQQFSMRRTLKIHITRIHNYQNSRVATGGAWSSSALHQHWGPSAFKRKAVWSTDDNNAEAATCLPEDWVDWKNDTATTGWDGTTSGWKNGGSSSSDQEERKAPQWTMGAMLQLPKKQNDIRTTKLKVAPRHEASAALPPPPVADMNCMTEDMLQNLLEMDFNPVQSELFFSTLAERGKEMSMDEAFIEALVVVLEAPHLAVSSPHEMSTHEEAPFDAFPVFDIDNDDTAHASFVDVFRTAPSDNCNNAAFTTVKARSRKSPPFKSPQTEYTAVEPRVPHAGMSAGSSARAPLSDKPSTPVASFSFAPHKASLTPSQAEATPKPSPPVHHMASQQSIPLSSRAPIPPKARKNPKKAARAVPAAQSVRATWTPPEGKTLQEYRKTPVGDDAFLKPVVAPWNAQQQRSDTRRMPAGSCVYCEADVGENNLARHIAENHTCPMCGCVFSPELIEIHVSACLEEHHTKEEEARHKEEGVPCPLCAQIFSSIDIAQHAAFCNGA